MNLASKIESLLFVSSKPLSTSQIAKYANGSEEEVRAALNTIATQRLESGIVLLEMNDTWQLATSPENVELVKTYLNADLRENLTDATVEVLAIIAYRQPVAKTEIEAIRGVNSQYSIRQLLMRGLIEKTSAVGDSRSTHYQLTTEFLQQMGVQKVEELPEYQSFKEKLNLPETVNTASHDPEN
jgi:segregation and condensation protein B